MAIKVARFLDVASGLQANQFSVGSHDRITALDELDPIYKRLLDEPVTAVFAVQGKDGRPNLTPMWFDYTGSTVLVNVASHRKKVQWIRANPRMTILLDEPGEPVSLGQHQVHGAARGVRGRPARRRARHRPARQDLDEVHEAAAVRTGSADPSRNERRVLFECAVDKVATFGKP